MDRIHKKVLSNKTAVIMQRISNPYILSGYLSNIFTVSDKEEIEAKYRQSGSTVATQHLIHLLEKRGPRTFPQFIEVLKSDAMKEEDLAMELENEERRLREQRDIKRARSLPPRPLEKPMTEGSRASPAPPYPAPIRSNSEMHHFSSEKQSPVHKQPQSLAGSNEQYQEQSSLPPEMNYTVDTLIKDIPYGVHIKVEKMMNPDDFNNRNWKGLAAAMGMSADDVRQLEGEAKGRMVGLFDRMIHTRGTVKDLLELLKHPDVQRLDVLEEIVHECNLPEELLMTNESCENEISGSNQPLSSVEECCKSMTNFKPMQCPRQESEDDRDIYGKLKPDVGIPRQEEHVEGTKERGQAELDAKPDARIPSHAEDSDEKDENE